MHFDDPIVYATNGSLETRGSKRLVNGTQDPSKIWKSLLLQASFFSIFLFTAPVHLSADIRQWDFETPEDYQFDKQKVEIKEGVTNLVANQPFLDGAESFEQGQFSGTWAVRGQVEMTPAALRETRGQDISLPLNDSAYGRVALWHFDEANGTNVLDEANRTIAKTNDTEIVTGQHGFNYARLFDGAKSYVFIPHYQPFQFSKAFSFEVWIKPTAAIAEKPQTLLSRWQEVGAQKSFALQIAPDGKLDLMVSPDGALTIRHRGETVLSPGVWYHAAAVYNGQDLRIYLNGALDGRPTLFSGEIHSSNAPIYLGALIKNQLDEFYEGVMDEAAFYVRPLSLPEILTHAGNSRGLVAAWHLNERGGPLNDASGYGLTAAAYGSPVYEVEGKFGTAVSLNGKDQYLEASMSTRFSAGGALTLEAWIKPDRLPGLGQSAAILSSVPAEDSASLDRGEYALLIDGHDGMLKATASGLNPSEVIGRLSLTSQVWQHVAAVWSEGQVRLYVNGVLDTAAPYKGILSTGKSALRIGMDSKKSAPFSGSIDEAAVFSRAKTDSEVAVDAGALASGGTYISPVKDAGSQAGWRAIKWKENLPYGNEIAADATGLLHLYHFNETGDGRNLEDAKDLITASPVGTYPVGGIFSQARWFQAKGYDKIISQKNMPSLSTFSITAWFQFAASEPGASDRLLSIGDGSPTVFRGSDGRMHVTMLGAREIVGSRTVKDTRWHHLALTADGRNLFLYIDGILDGLSPFISATAEAPLVLGNLKTTDTFQGALDEVAFFNYPLNRENLLEQYLSGSLHLELLVRASDDETFSGIPWRRLSGSSVSEVSAGATTVGLWHFNENLYSGRAGEVTDGSRFAHHGSAVGAVQAIPSGVAGSAALLNGAGDFIEIQDSLNLRPERFTISVWIKPQEMTEKTMTILDKQLKKGQPAFSSYALDLEPGNRPSLRIGHGRGYDVIHLDRDGLVTSGRWNHVAATYDEKEIRIYVNGRLEKTAPFKGALLYDDGALYLGRYAAGESRYFAGAIDECSIESRALSEEEITQIYLQGRSEVSLPEAKLPPLSGRYFQYQFRFTSSLPFAGPVLQGVEIRGNDFPVDRPWIMNAKTISFAEITHFRERLGPENRGEVSYQISGDGINWFYHNGRRWVAAGNASESNTAAQLESRLRDFSKDIGNGSFYFRAFLFSPTGLEPVSLDGVEIEFLPNKLTLTGPNGGEAWLMGTKQTINWTSVGELEKVTLEYSKDDFKADFHSIAKNISNTGSFSWKVPNDLSPHVKVRVMDGLEPRVYDASDISFRVIGALTVIAPNWNERWAVDSEQEIVWKTEGNIPEVRIDYSTDEFKTQIFPVVDSVKNDGKFKWKVAGPISPNMKVRISDIRDPLVFDQSNDTFAIHGNLALLSPEAGTQWIVGSKQKIRWQTTGEIPAVKIEMHSAKAPEWVTIADKFLNKDAFDWTVPDSIDPSTVLKVSDIRDRLVMSESKPFAITGGLRLINPKGGENWTAGSRRKIAWQTVGTIPAVDLEYKLAGSDVWVPIQKSLANMGHFVWEIPQDIASGFTVRVLDPENPFIQTANVEAAALIPSLSLLSPNGGESFQIGSEASIEWKTLGPAPYAALEYSKDNFAKDIHPIIPKASNLGRYSWKVPDDAGTKVRVRVMDPEHPSAQDISDSDFRIYGGFKFKNPQGGEKFQVGSLATLEWETLGTIPKVNLEYSHDDFVKDIRVIAKNISNEGRTTWTVPDDIGTGYAMRITDASDSATQEVSTGFFSVIGAFRLVNPAGGESFTVGTVVKIMWKGAGSVPVVRIDYSEDDFKASFNTIAGEAPNKGFYEWTVPNLIGHSFKLRIWDPSHPDAMDEMATAARIVGGFRLTSPNGGEVLYVGAPYEIQWETFGTISKVKLEFSDDLFGRHVEEIADVYGNIGRYEWHVPDTASGLYRVRISDPNDKAAADMSNADFRIRSKFTLLSPNGGEGWAVGETQQIRWQSSGSAPEVALELSADDFQSVTTLAEKAPNSGVFDWKIPDQVSQVLKIRVRDASDPDAADTSDSPFRIKGILQLESPLGGEIWKAGEQHAIQWKTTGRIDAVKLEYSRDGFSSESKVIIDSTANTGSFNWTIPDDLSENVKVRVIDLKDTSVLSVSPKPFQIAASFMMLAPNGGEVWHATDKRELTWVTVGTVREVNLEYSTDDFKTDPIVIDKGVLNSGRFLWEIPRETGDKFKVRVCDTESPEICDASDKEFYLRSPLEMVYPKGGESWPASSDHELRWNTYGSVPRVSVEYSTQAPYADWKEMISGLDNEGHYLFTVPDDLSKTVRFRVSDYEDSDIMTWNEKPVHFVGTFRVLSPNGGEAFPAGEMQKMTWDTVGTAKNVRLEYSSDNFQSDIKLIESSLENGGSYDWRVPPDLGAAFKVRVMDSSNEESADISDDPFRIMAGFTIQSPAGDEVWSVGSKQKILWKTEGRINRVRIEYRPKLGTAFLKEKGERERVQNLWNLVNEPFLPAAQSAGAAEPAVLWRLIAEVPDGGEFDWFIPEVTGKNLEIRILDSTDEAANAVSKPFEIRPDVILMTPNGGENLTIGKSFPIQWTAIGPLGPVKLEYSKDDFKQDLHEIKSGIKDVQNWSWIPGDDVTANAKLRIRSLEIPEVSDVSDLPFRILPSLKWLEPSPLPEASGVSPHSSEAAPPPSILKWRVGSNIDLKWDWRGSLDRVKIDYSINHFVSSFPVFEGPNTGQASFKVPDLANNQLQLRIADAAHPEASAMTEIPIKIVPSFNILSPNGGERLLAGDKYILKWETLGTANRVKLEYGDGSVWKAIAEVTRNTGSFEWQVPEDISSKVIFRVSDAADSDAYDESDKPFKILARFKLLSPLPDEVLEISKAYAVRWETSGKVPAVKLEYARLGAEGKPQNFQPIENLWINGGSFYWTVPDDAGEAFVLKVSDAREPDAFTISDSPFKIRGNFDLILPDNDLRWPVGSLQTLRWKTTGTIPVVKLEYTLDGVLWKPVTDSLPNSGTFGWKIPEDVAQKIKIKISDINNAGVFKEAEKTVSIIPQFEFLEPSQNEILIAGSAKKIRWKTTGLARKIFLEYSAQEEWLPIGGPMKDESVFEWTVPDAVSSSVKLRIRDAESSAFAISDPFKISGALTVTSPAKLAELVVGGTHTITWNTQGTIPEVRIEGWRAEPKSDTGEFRPADFVIAEKTGNQGHLDWVVPDQIGDHLKIRISDVRDASVASISEEFSVIGQLKLSSPKANDRWIVSSDQQIIWTTQGTLPRISLEYSRDDFYRDVNIISTEVPNTGAALWTIPDAVSDTVKVRISNSADMRTVDIAGPFKIKPQFSFLSPEGGEVWQVAEKHTLAWETTGSAPQIRLEYSRDNFRADIQTMQNTVDNQGSFEWQIPDIISSTVQIRMTDVRDASVSAVSRPFKVEGRLRLKNLHGGEHLEAFSKQKIFWETTGTIPRVRLEYSRDDFAEDSHILATDLTNEGVYNWVVPDDIGKGVKLRILQSDNFHVSDQTPEPFEIRGALVLTSFQEPKVFQVDSLQKISWQTVGTLPQVTLEYSGDDFRSDKRMIAGNIENRGSFEWQIPDSIGSGFKLRVVDSGNPEVSSLSAAPFAIQGKFDWLEPVKDQILRVEDEAEIRWKTTGTIPGVLVEYQAQPHEAWKLATGAFDNDGYLKWQVPDKISESMKLRVVDARDSEVLTESPGISVMPRFRFENPQGGERWIVGSLHDILWKTSGSVPEINLEYSTDDFVKDQHLIGEKIPNTGRFSWTVPDAITTNLKIRISNPLFYKKTEVISRPISVAGDFVPASPSASAVWKVGSSQVLEWQTVGSIPFVRLELVPFEDEREPSYVEMLARGVSMPSKISSGRGMIIQDLIPNENRFAWVVPDQIGRHSVRITDSRDWNVSQSFPPLKIVGDLKVTKPEKPEIWVVGENHRLEWQTHGSVPRLRLEYSRDGFNQDVQVVEGELANQNFYDWTAPDAISDTVQVRLRDVRDESVEALTASVRIEGALSGLKPVGPAEFIVGQRRLLEWQTTGTIPSVNIEFSTDGFLEKIKPVESSFVNDGHYEWVVPDEIAGQVWLRVSDARDGKIRAVIEQPFSIRGSLEISSFDSGLRFIVGSTKTLRWKTTGSIPRVAIAFSEDGFDKDIRSIAEVENRGSYDWQIPDSITTSGKVRISDPRYPETTRTLSPSFQIAGDFVPASPSASAVWKVGSSQVLEWQTVGSIPFVRLELVPFEDEREPSYVEMLARGVSMPSKISSRRGMIIQDLIPNENRFAWVVPDQIGRHSVRITDSRDWNVSQSFPPVKIEGDLHFTKPSESAAWVVGETRRLEWKDAGTIPALTLEYSRDDFQKDIQPVAAGFSNEGFYLWKVPDAISDTVKIRLRDLRDDQVAAVTKPIRVEGALHWIKPSAADMVKVGDKKLLEWETTGSIPQVRLEFSTDHFQEKIFSVDAVKVNEGRYEWQVPDQIAREVWLRIQDARDPKVFALLEQPLEIQGSLAMVFPQGGEPLTVGSQQNLLWKTSGTIPQVRVEYSRDGFKNDIQLAGETSNTGSFIWTVPDAISKEAAIRVSDSRDARVSASSNPFEIRGALRFDSLKQSEIWTVGEEHKLEWTATGTIPQIRLEFSRDGFKSDIRPVVNRVDNEGSILWKVPDLIAPSVTFRVVDIRDPEVAGYSENSAQIRGALSWVTPVDGEKWIVGSSKVLEWRTTGTIPYVDLEYSTDAFQTDIRSITPRLENKSRFLWTVPDVIQTVSFRVKDSADDKVLAVSPQIQIRGALEWVKPVQGNLLTVDSKHRILWKATGTIPQVRLEYSTDDFKSDIRVIENAVDAGRLEGDGTVSAYEWRVPDAISENVRLRAADVRNSETAAISEAFKIKGRLHLFQPAKALVWRVGERVELKWKTSGRIPAVRIDFSKDGFRQDSHTLFDSIPNQGSYEWNLEDPGSRRIWLRVTDAKDDLVASLLNEPVEIRGVLELLNPKGGEAYTVGETFQVFWKTLGSIPEIRMEYFPAEGSAGSESSVPLLIGEKIPNQGSYSWQIPEDVPARMQIRITDAENSKVFAETKVPLLMMGHMKMLAPASSAKWAVGSTQEIVWETHGRIPQVKVEYSRDGFKSDTGVIYPLIPNAGAVKWTVQDLISKDFRIRVSDAENPDVFAVTEVPVEVTGRFQLLTPSAGKPLEVGGREEISWQTLGTIPEVRLEYSKDGFARDSVVIQEKMPNAGRLPWIIPDDIADRVWIRISDASNPQVSSITADPFQIQGRLALELPKGGEIWKVGTDQVIRWKSVGTMARVNLEYSTDDFDSVTPIVSNLPNENGFSWRIPDMVSEKVKVRVRDAANPQVFSMTAIPIKIQGQLFFSSPSGGEFWESGSVRTVLWRTVGSIPYVTLEYSTDNFATVTPVILGLANDGRASWPVPDLSSEEVRFRLLDAHDQSVFTVSEPVQIGGTLELLSPGGGETLRVGDDEEIRWKTNGTVPRIRLEWSSDNFEKDVQVLESSLPNDGVYQWKVPDQIGANFRVRISDVKNPRITSWSAAPFKIHGAFAWVAPQGGDIWTVGSSQVLGWKTGGTISKVRLEYSTDDFRTAIPLAMDLENTGQFSWEVPDLAGQKLSFRVTDASDSSVSAVLPWEVSVEGTLELTSPRGGEVWTAGSRHPITWHTTGTIPNINLEYSTDDFRSAASIAVSISNTGSFLWTIPDALTQNLKIRVADALNAKTFSELDRPVEVQGELKISSPMGGEVWMVGTEHPITWTTSGQIEKVRVEFSQDDFRTVYPVALSVLNEGKFLWKVPDVISKEGRMRVSDDSNPAVSASSQETFEVRGAVTLLSPVGGEVWSVGSRHPISWQSNGTISQVRIDYSTDNFQSDSQAIVPVLANKGVYYWEVPPLALSGLKIRVTDISNPDVFDVSREDVRIAGNLELLSPLGGESYLVGERTEIKWKTSPNIPNVRLEYSTDNFETTKVISDYVPNTGRYVWNIPDLITDEIRVRVSDAANAMVYSASKTGFTTHGALKLISPKGGEFWMTGSRQNIVWETVGNIPKVRIEYSSDQFETALPIATNLDNHGAFEWTIPDAVNPEIQIRVSDAAAPSVYSTMPGVVTLAGRLEMITPSGGERWVAGEERVIRWQTVGTIPSVDLEYSKDDFNRDIHLIAAGTPNVGSYSWQVPNDISRDVKIRIRKSGDPKILAASESPFQIDYYRVRWMVRDGATKDVLGGLVMSESSGKTQSGITAPLVLEYPYSIYTTVWSKPGYREFKTTWLADHDADYTVFLEPEKTILETVRTTFNYDRERDLMKVEAWYEKSGKVQPAVLQAEIKIYDRNNLVKTLISSTPDGDGYFHMVWDTSKVEGNARYQASASITTAAGTLLTSPISFQLDIPVKERKEPASAVPVTSAYLKALGPMKPVAIPQMTAPPAVPDFDQQYENLKERVQEEKIEPKKKTSIFDEMEPLNTPKVSDLRPEKPEIPEVPRLKEEAIEKPELPSVVTAPAPVLPSVTAKAAPVSRKPVPQGPSELIVPDSAVLNEIVSIVYKGGAESRPALDLYDANRKLIIRGAPLKPADDQGTYQYLIPIKGLSFIPGKSVKVSVIDRRTGQFKSAEMMIQSSPTALGYDRETGIRTVLDVLVRLDRQIQVIRKGESRKFSVVLREMDQSLSELSNVLSMEFVSEPVLEKLNDAARELCTLATSKGYDSGFIDPAPLRKGAPLADIHTKLRDLRKLIEMLSGLYIYSSGAAA